MNKMSNSAPYRLASGVARFNPPVASRWQLHPFVGAIIVAGAVISAASLAGCTSSSNTNTNTNEIECEVDADCATAERCDVFAGTCRCVDNSACDVATGEVCTPDGSCQPHAGCEADSDCDPCQRCDTTSHECLCQADCACSEAKKCNDAGFCQEVLGCYDNDDCPAGEFCDTNGRECLPDGSCRTSLHCPNAKTCDGQTCVAGCVLHSDCPYKWSCVSDQCAEGICQDDSYCEFMETCAGAGACVSGYDSDTAPLCEPCDLFDFNLCDHCLRYQYEDDAFGLAHDNYCGSDCADNSDCPNGFSCNTTVTLSEAGQCITAADCPGNLLCYRGEGQDTGFCPCRDADNPCAQIPNNCDPDTRKCAGSGIPCGDTCFSNTCSELFGGNCGVTGDACGLLNPDLCEDNTCTPDATGGLSHCAISAEECTIEPNCPALFTPACVLQPGLDYGYCVFSQSCGLAPGSRCPE